MKTGLALFLLITFLALAAPLLTNQNPTLINLNEKLQGPNQKHWLGTDGNGIDIAAQILYGARLSLRVAVTVAVISTLIGLIAGSIAGYFGGLLDETLMRVIEILYAFPGFLLALIIIAFLGASESHLILALCITGWTAYGRLVRAEIQKLKSQDFVEAALALGNNATQIITKHLWPNLISLLAVQITFGLAATVINEAGLSFLGLGAPTNTPSWGALLADGRQYIFEAPHICLAASSVLVLLVLSLNLMGEGLRRHFNPKSS